MQSTLSYLVATGQLILAVVQLSRGEVVAAALFSVAGALFTIAAAIEAYVSDGRRPTSRASDD